jgi:hypothetical protein
MNRVVHCNINPIKLALFKNVLGIMNEQIKWVNHSVSCIETVWSRSIRSCCCCCCSLIHASILKSRRNTVKQSGRFFSVKLHTTKSHPICSWSITCLSHPWVLKFTLIVEHAEKTFTVNFFQVVLSLQHSFLCVGQSVDLSNWLKQHFVIRILIQYATGTHNWT